jgi:hypothetical protein
LIAANEESKSRKKKQMMLHARRAIRAGRSLGVFFFSFHKPSSQKRPAPMAAFSLFLVALLSWWIEQTAGASYNLYPYLYEIEGGVNKDSFPIFDHIAPQSTNGELEDRPDFLYYPPPDTYRVVEFYVHWCGICRHFSRRYIEYARKVQKILDGKANVTFHAVSCVPNRLLCKMQKVAGYPLLRLLKPGETGGLDLRHTDTNPLAILRNLGLFEEGMTDFDEEVIDETESIDSVPQASWWDRWLGVRSAPHETTIMMRRTRDDLRDDIHLSFDFSMRNGVYMTDEDDKLSDSAKAALKNYLILLRRTMPTAWKDFHELLDKLLRNLHYVVRKETYMIRFLDSHKPKGLVDGEAVWSPSCSRGEPGRGYTCGLWETFHVATVGAVHYNRDQVNEDLLLAPEQVAVSIRNFIDNFFQCSECRENFLRMFDSCGHNRCDRLKKKAKLGAKVAETEEEQIGEWEQTSLWLSEVHNAVNVRLLREKAQREKRNVLVNDVVAVHWPAYSECRPCWERFDPKSGLGIANETVTLQYLKLEYGHRDESMADFQQFLQEANSGAEDPLIGSDGPAPVDRMYPFLVRLVVMGFSFALYGAMGGKIQVPHMFRRFILRKARTL